MQIKTQLSKVSKAINANLHISHSYTAQHDGNVSGLVNALTGVLTHTYEYDPFGNVVSGQYDGANHFRHATKYQDLETGYYRYTFRYFNAEIGRWNRRDMIGVAGGLNVYGFNLNNGVNRIDLLGNDSFADIVPVSVQLKIEEMLGKIVNDVFPPTNDSPTNPKNMFAETAFNKLRDALKEEFKRNLNCYLTCERKETDKSKYDLIDEFAERLTWETLLGDPDADYYFDNGNLVVIPPKSPYPDTITTSSGYVIEDPDKKVNKMVYGMAPQIGPGGLRAGRGGYPAGKMPKGAVTRTLPKTPKSVTDYMNKEAKNVLNNFKKNCSPPKNASHSSSNANKLSKDLASRHQMGEVGQTMAGKGAKAPFRNAERVANQYGGKASDWVKKTSSNHKAPDGTRFEIHWVENIKTGQRVEFKTKINQ